MIEFKKKRTGRKLAIREKLNSHSEKKIFVEK